MIRVVTLLATLCLFAQADDRLIGGTPVDPQDWQAEVWVGNCSATLIGSRTVVLAAHCVNEGGRIGFKAAGQSYRATCHQNPDYRRNYTSDYALCLSDKPVTGVLFERINTDRMNAMIGQEITLTGWGCTKKGGGIDGINRKGKATIDYAPKSWYHYIRTKGLAVLCPGDSGGPAFLEKKNGSRLLLSVNSRTDFVSHSYLAALHEDVFLDWIDKWMDSTGDKICGLTMEAMNCRDKK